MKLAGEGKPKGRLSANLYVFAALVLVSFLALLFSTRSFVVSFRDTGLSAYSGVRSIIHSVSGFFSGTVLSIKELATLRREYNELTDRMNRYERLERDYAQIRQENARLKEQLGFSTRLRYSHVAAEITGRDPDNLFSALVINKGRRHGVQNNMPVIAYQNGVQALAGKVIQAGLLESLFMPLFDTESHVAARLARSRYEGIIEGQGSYDKPLLMRFVPKQAREDILQGDVIATSGMGGVFPRSLNVGRVAAVHFRDYETSIEIELESTIDFSRLEYVFVLINEQSELGDQAEQGETIDD
jgi:rod shape-determining protein MreC